MIQLSTRRALSLLFLHTPCYISPYPWYGWSNHEEAVPIGILSADYRDRWTEVSFVLPCSLESVRRAHPLQTRRPSKSSNSRPSPSVLILTPSDFTQTRHAPHQPSTRLRKSIATFTTFVPRSMPGTGGSIRVIPSSSRPTPVRGRWVNIHRATPLCPASLPIMPSHSLSFPFSSPEPPPFFSGRDLDGAGWERLEWVTDARIEAECVAAESRAVHRSVI